MVVRVGRVSIIHGMMECDRRLGVWRWTEMMLAEGDSPECFEVGVRGRHPDWLRHADVFDRDDSGC
jgi:hypothetical protein